MLQKITKLKFYPLQTIKSYLWPAITQQLIIIFIRNVLCCLSTTSGMDPCKLEIIYYVIYDIGTSVQGLD